MKFRDFLNESKSYKVSTEQFNTEKFQEWISKNLGETETKNNTTIYNNKAGKPVFSYDSKNERLMILQPKLEIDQLVEYGLVIKK